MGNYDILILEEKCTGCFRCELACSHLFTKAFNPSRSRIRVMLSGADCVIELTEECNGCGVCVDHCLYDALRKSEREAVR